MKSGRKREQMISPEFPKKARLDQELEEKVEKLKKITLDIDVMEKCMGFLKTKKEEICSELEEFGVDMSELESSDVSHWSLSQNLSLSRSTDMRLDPDSVRTSDRETESLDKSDHEGVGNTDDVIRDSDSVVLIEDEENTKSDMKSDKVKHKGSKRTDSSIYEKPNLKEFSKKSGLKKVSKKIDFKEVSKKLNLDAVTKLIKKEPVESTSSQIVANIAPLPVDPKSDEDSDVIVLSDSSYEFPTIPEQKIEQVDLMKVKKEKGVGKGKDDEISQIEGLTRNIIKNMVQKNESGRVMCPLKCGKDFKSVANMFRHVDDEVCIKKISERSTLVCRIKECDHTCVTAGAMKAHEYSHFNLKPYECPHEGCDCCYAQPTSLNNHKHIKHKEIFGPFPKPRTEKTSSGVVGGNSSEKNKKKKKKKASTPKPNFSSDSD